MHPVQWPGTRRWSSKLPLMNNLVHLECTVFGHFTCAHQTGRVKISEVKSPKRLTLLTIPKPLLASQVSWLPASPWRGDRIRSVTHRSALLPSCPHSPAQEHGLRPPPWPSTPLIFLCFFPWPLVMPNIILSAYFFSCKLPFSSHKTVNAIRLETFTSPPHFHNQELSLLHVDVV